MTRGSTTRTRRPVARALAALGVPLLLSFTYIAWLAHRSGGGRRLVVLHVALVGCLLLLALLALAGLRRLGVLPGGRGGRLTVALLGTAAGLALLTLYVGNAISHAFWQDSLSYSLLDYWVLELHLLRDPLPVARGWVYLVAAVVLALSAAGSWVLSGPLGALIDPPGRRRGGAPGALGALAAGALLMAAVAALAVLARPGISLSADSKEAVGARFLARRLVGVEPILGLLGNDTAPTRFGEYWQSLDAAARDAGLRASYPRPTGLARRNVVLIVADSLRPDHMSLFGYRRATTPFLERLHRGGSLVAFDLAMATCPQTPCGVGSMLTSRVQATRAPGSFGLHTLLRDQGYRVHFILSGDHDWQGLEQLYRAAADSYFDGPMSRRWAAADDRTVYEGLDAVADYDGTPTLLYFHIMAPHVLAARQPRHNLYLPADSSAWLLSVVGRPDRGQAVNFYDNGVVLADDTVEGIFERLAAKGYLEDALVLIASDHGEALGERRERIYGHFPELYQLYLRIPVLVYDPDPSSYANLEFARQIDLAPTIVDRLGLPIPASWHGVSLLRPDGPRYAFATVAPADGSHALLLRREGKIFKYLRYSSARYDAREELYELASDPQERRDLIADADAELVSHLRDTLDEMLRDPAAMARVLRQPLEP